MWSFFAKYPLGDASSSRAHHIRVIRPFSRGWATVSAGEPAKPEAGHGVFVEHREGALECAESPFGTAAD
jgi:hypothetical protein